MLMIFMFKRSRAYRTSFGTCKSSYNRLTVLILGVLNVLFILFIVMLLCWVIKMGLVELLFVGFLVCVFMIICANVKRRADFKLFDA